MMVMAAVASASSSSFGQGNRSSSSGCSQWQFGRCSSRLGRDGSEEVVLHQPTGHLGNRVATETTSPTSQHQLMLVSRLFDPRHCLTIGGVLVDRR